MTVAVAAEIVGEAAEVVEAEAAEFVAEHEPELGLSDDVFPAGGRADEAERPRPPRRSPRPEPERASLCGRGAHRRRGRTSAPDRCV